MPIGCKAIFVATSIGKTPTNGILDMLSSSSRKSVLTELKSVILLKDQTERNFDTYDHLRETGKSFSREELSSIMASNTAGSICNLQFTSGTTGAPKAAMLTHLSVFQNTC
jgi:mevalonyl-CoA ligase